MARRERCRQVHSALTQQVNVTGARKVKHGAASKKMTSGQLPFLGRNAVFSSPVANNRHHGDGRRVNFAP